MTFDDLLWKLWEIEEDIREKRAMEHSLRLKLRQLIQSIEFATTEPLAKVNATLPPAGELHGAVM